LRYSLFILIYVSLTVYGTAQDDNKLHYTGSDGKRIYLPLGKISFADSVVGFNMGYPRPISIFRDSSQALHKPNYRGYDNADFFTMGCEGNLTLKFTNNGFMNLKGHDLTIFEVGPSKEHTVVEISTDGENWIAAGVAKGGTSKLEFDDKNIDPNLVFYYVRLKDIKDECSGRSAGADIDAVAAINSVIRLTVNADVLFDVDQYRLKSTAKRTIDSLAQSIQVVENATILIEGHTDSDGDEEYNLRLSNNRCQSVRRKLKQLLSKFGTYKLETKAYGESKPRVENSSAENKQINRRVEIMVFPPQDYYDSLPEN
jgi:OOP family OmpA-OmpF porin